MTVTPTISKSNAPTPTPTPQPGDLTLNLIIKNSNTTNLILETVSVILTYNGSQQTKQTDSGTITFDNLPGLQPISISIVSDLGNYFTLNDNITVSENNQTNTLFLLPKQNFAAKFVLTWGNDVRDLDSHLFITSTQGDFHIYYGNKGFSDSLPFSLLDVDDVSYEGPETTTIFQFLENATYTFSVFDYTHRNSVDNYFTPTANVKIYDEEGNKLYDIQSTGGSGTWWNICTIDSNLQITILNNYYF